MSITPLSVVQPSTSPKSSTFFIKVHQLFGSSTNPLSPPHTSGYPRPCHAGPWQGHGEAQGRPVPATEPAPRLRGARRRGRADPGLLPGTPGTAAGHAEAATDGAGEVGGGTAEKDGAEETTGGDRWN